MAFARISGFVSRATNRLATTPSSSTLYESSGLSPQESSIHGYGLSNSEKKNNLRLSSSLQDLSAYRRIDPEKGDLNMANSTTMIHHSKPPLPLQRDNNVQSFSKDKEPPRTPFLRKKWVRIIIGVFFFIFFVSIIFFISRYFFTKASRFYVVLDCGSTGTRVYVYQASNDHKTDSSLPFTVNSYPEILQRKSKERSGRAYNRMETEPGFEKLVNNVSGLKKAIKPLVQWAKKQIPKKAHKTTSLFLYATAGVRRLPSTDSEWLLNNAWSILKSSPFLCQRDWVKTITGMEEAYFGWIALNYHTGMLGSIPRKPTFGALDLGGSSLQVTFESKEDVSNETSLNLRIGSANHHLSAYSLPRYGLNDAFDKSVVRLVKNQPGINNADLINGKIKLKHPCLQTGYEEQYNCLQCASSSQDAESPLTGGKKLGTKPGTPIQLIGAPNWEECNALAKISVNLSEWSNQIPGLDCEVKPCALSDNLPRPHGQFYAMSGFFVVYRFFNLTSEAALDDVLEKGQKYCEKTWDVAKNSVTPQPFIEQYCFRAPYVVSLLREGLHIVDEQVTIGSGSITWTLGVALLEAGRTFSTSVTFHSFEIFQMKINPAIILAIIVISLIIVMCAVSCGGGGGGGWMPRFFRRPYLPLFKHNSVSTTSVLNIPSPFRLQRWSPISSGDGRVKLPLSPTIGGTQNHGYTESSIQLMKSSLNSSSSSVSHSYSSGSLVQMQVDNSSINSFWNPHRGQMRLQSRRSQSREDLSSSMADTNFGKI